MSTRRTVLACLAAGLLGVLCAVAVGCGQGSSKLLSASDASALNQTLTQVRQAVALRQCGTAGVRLTRLQTLVLHLPRSVDLGLRTNLRQEIGGTLAPQVKIECATPLTEVVPTLSTPAPTPTATPPTTSTPTLTTPTTPTPTTTTSTTPPPTSTAPAPPSTDTSPGATGGAPGAPGATG